MSPEREAMVRAAFDQVVHAAEAERASALEAACRGDSGLRRELQALLEARERAGDFLNRSVCSAGVVREAAISTASLAGATIGRYRLSRLIGEGGMGAVYEALQENPQRTVAVKIIASPLASREVLRRFDSEAQILGRLRHPALAQVHEAGVHAVEMNGARGLALPYIAMEYIEGAAPITQYCRERALPVRDRICLFIQVCEAVQHGHQHGVIHRDLKPANILVDSAARPKVIDFGVARAVGSDLGLESLGTEKGELLGTPAYMAPEQFAGDPAAVDTRADVYALGVVLYELLASRHPLWEKTPTFLDAARIVRTQEPRPLAASDRSLRGDLATIVAKALAKEPRCRYHSAQELAADLGRFLRDEPISARPATPMYQLGKLARRNPRLVGACAAVLLSLALGLGAALWGLARAQEALRETTAARAAAAEQAVLAHRRADAAREAARFLGDIIAAASPRSGNASAPLGQVSVAAAEQIEAAPPEDPLVEAAIRDALGEVFIGQGELDKAERQIERAMELRTRVSGAASADALDSTLMLAVLRMEQGRCQEVEAMIRPACELAARSLGESAPLSRNLLATWGVSLTMVGDLAGAERAISRSLELTLAQENPEPCEVAQIRGQYGAVLEALGRHSEAETSLRATIEAMEAMELPDDDVAVVARINLASALVELRPAEALAMARDVVARTERVAQGRENSRSLMARAVFAGCLLANGTAAEAEAELRNLRPAAEQLFGPDNAEVVNMDAMLAAALCGQGRHEEALTIFDGVAAKSGAFGPTDSWRLVRIKLDHARCCLHAGRAEDAATLAEEALAAAKASFGPEDARSRAAQGLLEEAGRASEIVAAR